MPNSQVTFGGNFIPFLQRWVFPIAIHCLQNNIALKFGFFENMRQIFVRDVFGVNQERDFGGQGDFPLSTADIWNER